VKTALITVQNDLYKPIGEITLPLMTRYCERRGYHFRCGQYHTNPSDLPTYGDRGKVELFNRFYLQGYDYVMFLDLDVVIMNSDMPVQTMLGFRPFLWTYDHNGPLSGFWIAKCEPQVYMTMNAIKNGAPAAGKISVTEDVGPPHGVNLRLEPHGASDQMMMRSLMNIPPFGEVLGEHNCLPGGQVGHTYPREVMKLPKEFPNINDYYEGAFCVTFPGVPLQERIELCRQWAERAV
jgi:hypothetical protein